MSDAAVADQDAFDVEAYRSFIGQLALRDIWLAGAKIENRWGPVTPDKASVLVEDHPAWETHPGGFRASVRYRVRFKVGSQTAGTIEATYAVEYASAQAMTEAIFAVFAANNLPLNTWPYLRAFVADTLGRLGWLPFTLPSFKINVAEPSDEPPPQPKRRRTANPGNAGASS